VAALPLLKLRLPKLRPLKHPLLKLRLLKHLPPKRLLPKHLLLPQKKLRRKVPPRKPLSSQTSKSGQTRCFCPVCCA
jgi:hypothetical protein